MKRLFQCVLIVAFALGVTTPSKAFIPFLVEKVIECPPVAKMMRKCRAKMEAHKTKAKKPLFGRCRDCQNDCACD